MNIRRRVRKRLPKRVKEPLTIPGQSDQVWSMDFMNDSLYDGRRFRILNIIDDYNREILAMEIDTSISSERVVRVLGRLKDQGRKPTRIRVDNGPEFISGRFQLWCRENQVEVHYIQPGKPTQNSLIERFNGSCRKELLNMYVFKNISEVEELADQWWQEYNYSRPHEALNNLSPMDYKKEYLLI
jgi:putative transposase